MQALVHQELLGVAVEARDARRQALASAPSPTAAPAVRVAPELALVVVGRGAGLRVDAVSRVRPVAAPAWVLESAGAVQVPVSFWFT